MNNAIPVQSGIFGRLQVQIFNDKRSLGESAAQAASRILADTIRDNGQARVIIATGNSQDEVIAALTADRSIDWSRVTAFHMDEYVGVSADHSASFRRWLRTRVADVVHPRTMHYLNGDAADIEAECSRYGALLREAPIDICFAGIGENGHLAFNDPHVADFNDPLTVKRAELDDACRRQQVGEGHFPNLDAVPQYAVTITCPTIMACRHVICCAPDRRKAKAVSCSLLGPVDTACPGSLLQTHPQAWLYLDKASASLLKSGLTAAE